MSPSRDALTPPIPPIVSDQDATEPGRDPSRHHDTAPGRGANHPAPTEAGPVGARFIAPVGGGGLLSAIGLAWRVAFEAVRDFVWADLKDGVLDLRGLGSPLRALVWLGFGLMLLGIVAMLQGDVWRQSFPLVALTQGIPGRGRLIPSAVIPVSYFLLTLAWAFLLAGALRSRRLIRFGVLGAWALTMAGATISSGVAGVLTYALNALTLLAVPLAFLIFSFMRPRRVLEMLVLLALVTANNAMNQLQGVASWQTSGMPLMVMRLSFEMASLSTVIMPLLLLVGMDVAGFAYRAAGWVTTIAEERLARWVPIVLLVALLGWRLWETGQEVAGWLDDGPLDLQLIALAGGLSVPILVGIAWLAVRALAPPADTLPDPEAIESTASPLALPLILSYTGTLVIVLILSGFALALAVGSLFVRALVPIQEQLVAMMGWVGTEDFLFVWHLTVDAGALAVAVLLARRGQHAGALFLAILGLLDIKRRLSEDGRPLEILAAAGPGNRTDIWWVLLFAAIAVWWLARRELTPHRASALAFVTLITLLLRQTDFISNRFSPFVASGGLGFIAFGLIWDALTIGSWANVGSRGLPRVSRIFLYIGYVLLTVTVVNWAVASHDLEAVGRLTGDVGLVGLEAFGKPLLYTIFVLTLAGAFRHASKAESAPSIAASTQPHDIPDGHTNIRS